MEQYAAHGQEKGWLVPAMRRLLAAQPSDGGGQISPAQHGGPGGLPGGCKIFSKLDLRKGYLQVPVATADVDKTAKIMPFGLFEFVRMPFGLRNAGMMFQCLMDSLLGTLSFAFIYLDDILIASQLLRCRAPSALAAVFSLLQENGLVVNAGKCLFGCTSVELLGHRLSQSGISPLPS